MKFVKFSIYAEDSVKRIRSVISTTYQKRKNSQKFVKKSAVTQRKEGLDHFEIAPSV